MTRSRIPTKKIFISIILLIISALMIAACVNKVVSYERAKKQYNALVKEEKALEKEKNGLDKEVKELNDDDYVVRYARDHYIFSKDGEKAVIVPDES